MIDPKTVMYAEGRRQALALQEAAPTMTGTELNAEEGKIPSFRAACDTKNMMNRKAGQTDGFVCKSSAGRVVRLIQNYDSDVLPQSRKTCLLSGALYGLRIRTMQNLFWQAPQAITTRGTAASMLQANPNGATSMSTPSPPMQPRSSGMLYDNYYDHNVSGLLEED